MGKEMGGEEKKKKNEQSHRKKRQKAEYQRGVKFGKFPKNSKRPGTVSGRGGVTKEAEGAGTKKEQNLGRLPDNGTRTKGQRGKVGKAWSKNQIQGHRPYLLRKVDDQGGTGLLVATDGEACSGQSGGRGEGHFDKFSPERDDVLVEIEGFAHNKN